MHEEIANGYRLSCSPHKRPEYHSQSITTFLRSYLTGNTANNVSSNQKPSLARINKHHSFSHNQKQKLTSMPINTNKNSESLDHHHYLAEREKLIAEDQSTGTNNLYVENSISGNEIKMRKNFTEGLLKSSSINKLEQKHPSQSSLTPNHNQNVANITTHGQQQQLQHQRKLVSSKSISSPLSRYTNTVNNTESVRQSLEKRLQQSSSMDQQQLESILVQMGKPTRTEKLLVRGYLNKFSKNSKTRLTCMDPHFIQKL